MKRLFAVVAILLMTMSAATARASGMPDWLVPVAPTATPAVQTQTPAGEYRSEFEMRPLTASLNQSMSLRTGPGNAYTEIGTYPASTPIVLYQQEMGSGVAWGLVEFRLDTGLCRAYTGMKRINARGSVPWGNTTGVEALLAVDAVPLYGPGSQYAPHKKSLPMNTAITIFHEENGFVMADFQRAGDSKRTRAWFPLTCVANYVSADRLIFVTATPGPTRVPAPTAVPITDVVAYSLGGNHTAFIDRYNELWMVGWNEYGQVGNGTHDNLLYSARNVLKNVTQVSCGFYHTLAMDDQGYVYTWGRGSKGQLGNGKTTNTDKPNRVKMTDASSISAGDCNSFVMTSEGLVYAWGSNECGQLGVGSKAKSVLTPTRVEGLRDVVAISAGDYATAALTADGLLYTFGDNSTGQLGVAGITMSRVPVPVALERVAQVSVGDYHMAALTEDGDMYIWGSNEFGQLGDWTQTAASTPLLIMRGVRKIALGDYHTFAITYDGTLYAWGRNHEGQLGVGDMLDVIEPTVVTREVINVETGYAHSACILMDGRIMGWGRAQYGQLTLRESAPVLTPQQIAPLRR